MAKCNNSNSNEMTPLSRKNSNVNSKTPLVKHSSANKIKIAHRTRSKCPIERNISDLEADLPDDLLLNTNETPDVTKIISNNNLNLSHNDSLLTSASTPSAYDPNDQIYQEFLNHLLAGDQAVKENESPSKLIDNDDASEDPDYTVCLESYNENLDFDLDITVPKKEVIELISDQLFFDTTPLVCNDYRVKTKRMTTFTKSNSTESNSSGNQVQSDSLPAPQLQSQSLMSSQLATVQSVNVVDLVETQPIQQTATTTSHTSNQALNSLGEFIPQFNDLQRKQLDEQLRNHVQLLTQMCLVCYNSTEYVPLYSEARNLLKVLDSLNKDSLASDEITNDSNSQITRTQTNQAILSAQFEIINLKDALKVIEELDSLNLPKWDLNNGVPTKILELIVNNRVFYNTNLIPVNKYKYSSQFTRSSFTDCEKILLIMGFNQFKHLPKDECCKCIKEAVLAHRSCHDIKKQLSSISNSEQRQSSLKELIKRQKSSNLCYVENFEFKKELHYKSPLEQADNIQLPSMYTLTVERLKMANILKETKNITNQNIQKAQAEKEKKSKRARPRVVKSKIPDAQIQQTSKQSVAEKQIEKSSSNNDSISVIDSDDDCIVVTNDTFNNDFNNQVNDDNDLSILSTTISKRPRVEALPERAVTPARATSQLLNDTINQQNFHRINIESTKQPASIIESVPSNALLNLLSNRQQTVIIDQSGRVVTMPSLFSPIQTVPNLQCLPILPQLIQQPQQSIPSSNLVLPNSFNGTILYHPTIHIHTNGKNFVDMSKYKKLAPKK